MCWNIRTSIQQGTACFASAVARWRHHAAIGCRRSKDRCSTAPQPDEGCVFAPRCPFAEARCTAGNRRLSSRTPGHLARCWNAKVLGTGRIGRRGHRPGTVPSRRRVGEHHTTAQDIHHAARSGGLADVRLAECRVWIISPCIAAVDNVSVDLARRGAGSRRRKRLWQVYARSPCSAAAAPERWQCRI